jgi:hypothetical protein
MIQVDAELLLAVGIVAFYLFDSASLLHFDELVVAAHRRGWQIAAGGRLEMRGRFLWLPHPLLPFRTVLPASWLSFDADAADTPQTLQRFARRLLPIRIGCGLAGLLVVAAIPTLLLTTRDPAWLLCALAGTWLITIAMLVALFLQRGALGLGGRGFAGLCVESLLCPPCAPNLHRRLCRRRGFRGDPVAFASCHMTTDAQRRLRDSIEARIAMFALADQDDGGHVVGGRAAPAPLRSRRA